MRELAFVALVVALALAPSAAAPGVDAFEALDPGSTLATPARAAPGASAFVEIVVDVPSA